MENKFENIQKLANLFENKEALKKALGERQDWVKRVKNRQIREDEVYEIAKKDAEEYFSRFKKDLDGRLSKFPLSQTNILQEVSERLRKEEPFGILSDWSKEEVVTLMKGFPTEDGYEQYKIVRDDFINHKKYKYLESFYETTNVLGDTQQKVAVRPTFNPAIIPPLLDILKPFFDQEHFPELENILQTGGSASQPLLFRDNGNRLGNAFKQLKEADFITGCQKQDLHRWVIQNFTYIHNKKEKTFTPDYAEKCISRNNHWFNNMLFTIKKGQIVRKP